MKFPTSSLPAAAGRQLPGNHRRARPRRGFARCFLMLLIIPLSMARAAGSSPTSDSMPDLSAATTLLDLLGVIAGTNAISRQMTDELRASNPAMPEAVWTRFAALTSERATLVALYAPIYVRHLSAADIDGLVAFYASPLGSRLRQALPQIASEAQASAQALVASIELESEADPAVTPGVAEDARSRAVQVLLHESGALRQARTGIAAVMNRLRASQSFQDIPPSFWDAVQRRLTDESVLLTLWTPAYVRHLSEADVAALIAFYRSALGKRYSEAQPAIQAESVEAATTLANRAARRAVREVLGPLPQWRLQHPAAGTDDSR